MSIVQIILIVAKVSLLSLNSLIGIVTIILGLIEKLPDWKIPCIAMVIITQLVITIELTEKLYDRKHSGIR